MRENERDESKRDESDSTEKKTNRKNKCEWRTTKRRENDNVKKSECKRTKIKSGRPPGASQIMARGKNFQM